MPETGNPSGVDHIPHLAQMESREGSTEPGGLEQEELGGEAVPVHGPCSGQAVAQALPHLLLASIVLPRTLAQLQQLCRLPNEGPKLQDAVT